MIYFQIWKRKTFLKYKKCINIKKNTNGFKYV